MKDLEDVLNAVIDHVRRDDNGKTLLNTLIDEKNTEKGDNLLSEIPDEDKHYLIGGMIRETVQLKNWFDVSPNAEPEVRSNGGETLITYNIRSSIFFYDSANKDDYRKALRYQAVLIDALENLGAYVRETVATEMTGTNIVPVSANGRNAMWASVDLNLTIAM